MVLEMVDFLNCHKAQIINYGLVKLNPRTGGGLISTPPKVFRR